jgi:hypothetical protein
MSLNDFYKEFYATQIDFRYNRKTGTYGVVRFNADPTMILYKDGVARKTTDQEIDRQLRELLV